MVSHPPGPAGAKKKKTPAAREAGARLCFAVLRPRGKLSP